MKKAAAYARFSSDNQRQESIDAQVRAIQDYCAKCELHLIKIYQDEAMSATNDQRDQFLQMIDDAKKHEFEYVIVHKLDRFARNRYDSAFYKRELRVQGVRILSVLENLDDSPESIILESVLEGMAEYYSKNLAREVRKGQKENALKGIHNGGIPPFGYSVVNKILAINEQEAEIVRMIFKLYNEGSGYTTISDTLNSLGYKTRAGRPFSINSLYDLIRNEKYTGTYVFNKRESKSTGNRKYKPDDQIVRIEGAFPAIISRELWDMVQEIISKKTNVRRLATREYLLKGKIVCAICGGTYVGSGYVLHNDSDHYTYSCSTRRRSKECDNKPVYAGYLEDYIVHHIIGNFMTDQYIENVTKKFNEDSAKELDENMAILARVDKQTAKQQQKETKLWELFYDGIITKAVFQEKQVELENELKDLEKVKSEVMNKKVVKTMSPESFTEFLLDLQNKAKDDNQNTKKLLIAAFVDRVVVNKEIIDLHFRDYIKETKTNYSDATGGDEGSRTPVQIASTFNPLQFSLR